MTAAEIVPADAQYARELTDRIRVGVEAVWHLIVEAYQRRAWDALGYASWDDYCTREFGTSRLRLPREERTETVQSLRAAGLSLRAIAASTGDSVTTVRRSLAGVPNGTPAEAHSLVDVRTGDVFDAPDADVMAMSEASEPEFERAVTRAREQDDLSARNVVSNLPRIDTTTPVTGTDGKRYAQTAPRKAPRKALVEVAKTRGFAIRQATDSLLKLFEDDRYRANEKQVADVLRGHLLYVAETVSAVLDQLP